MKKISYHRMKIRELSLPVSLGCTTEERARLQEVRISVELRFAEVPLGTESDRLNDTICYAKICEALKSYVECKEFHLIEKMANDFDEIIRKIIDGRAESSVIVHKVKPPINNLLGGVEYRIGDFP